MLSNTLCFYCLFIGGNSNVAASGLQQTSPGSAHPNQSNYLENDKTDKRWCEIQEKALINSSLLFEYDGRNSSIQQRYVTNITFRCEPAKTRRAADPMMNRYTIEI